MLWPYDYSSELDRCLSSYYGYGNSCCWKLRLANKAVNRPAKSLSQKKKKGLLRGKPDSSLDSCETFIPLKLWSVVFYFILF